MKKFVFKYSALAWVMIVVIAALFATSTAINFYDAVSFWGENTAKTVIAITVAAISFFAFVSAVAAAVYGRYIVKGNYLYCRFGFFYTKTKIADIFQVTEFTALNKLVMYYKDEKYSVAVISEKYYGEFYEALKAVNPDIIYTIQSAEEK
ncbi:MAG: hypothetical protein IJQ23_04050 [Clostridia bacterium]|nr:hypothetical protein [Clostridia bacterium]